MKRILVLGAMLATSVGCSGMNNTESGAVGGGLIGGALGALFGAAFHAPLAGAAIGAAAGAGVGALEGHAEDKREDAVKQAVAQQQAQMVTLTDVVTMTQQHVPDATIINQINATYSNFNLTPDQIIFLRQQGVSDTVITVMQQRRSVPVGYVYPRRYGYYEPAPAGVVIVGGGYRRW